MNPVRAVGNGDFKYEEGTMKNKWAIEGFLGCLVLLTSVLPAFAGDSLYGKVTEVRSADVVILDNGSARFVIRIVGINTPQEGPAANEARQFLSKLVLGKNARMRLEFRNKNGEMVAQLLTDDPEIGIKDVGVELVRAGMVRRQANYDYKYGELSKAEEEARKAARGVWAQTPPK
jgi:endonuclease YncB( thermonuclease family)